MSRQNKPITASTTVFLHDTFGSNLYVVPLADNLFHRLALCL
jgi:hypothetical protein